MRYQKGLTLLELVIVITMVGILLIAAFGFLNPFEQFQKAKDSQATSDVAQITTALDVYYNDNSCYPSTIPFGEEWKEGETVYMPLVPEGDNCSSDGSACYLYAVNGSCPQWNVIFAKLSESPKSGNGCELAEACLPQNYTDEWSCIVSGNVDCSSLSTFSLPEEGEEFCPAQELNYGCTGAPPRCNILPAGTGTYCSSNCDGNC